MKNNLLLTFKFSKPLNDYIHLTGAVNGIFDHQKKWEHVQITLSKQYETKTKKKMIANKIDKMQQVKNEIKQQTKNIKQGEKDFEHIFKTSRKEEERGKI